LWANSNNKKYIRKYRRLREDVFRQSLRSEIHPDDAAALNLAGRELFTARRPSCLWGCAGPRLEIQIHYLQSRSIE
jgi:hypothetical protein